MISMKNILSNSVIQFAIRFSFCVHLVNCSFLYLSYSMISFFSTRSHLYVYVFYLVLWSTLQGLYFSGVKKNNKNCSLRFGFHYWNLFIHCHKWRSYIHYLIIWLSFQCYSHWMFRESMYEKRKKKKTKLIPFVHATRERVWFDEGQSNESEI